MILALDLSLTHSGFAMWGNPEFHSGTIKPPTTAPIEERLDRIVRYVADLAQKADHVFIEDFVTRSFQASNLGMVHGVVRHALFVLGVPSTLVPPASLKTYATNRGNATKDDMRMELYKRYRLDERDDNIVDAIWLAAMGADLLGVPSFLRVPEANRRALKKLTTDKAS